MIYIVLVSGDTKVNWLPLKLGVSIMNLELEVIPHEVMTSKGIKSELVGA